MSANREPGPRSSWWPRILGAGLLVACLALRLQVAGRANLEDDAFITFRYAANLAEGGGFAYNHGERVLGTTSPLLTLLLAVLALLGVDVPSAGLALSVLGSVVCCVLIFAIVTRLTGSLVGAVGGAALFALSSLQARVAASGMDTALMQALMLGSFALLIAGRNTAAGLLGGFTALTRPEGVIWLALALPFACGDRRLRWGALSAALLPPLAWLAFATWHFGSPVPQSVTAKLGHAGWAAPNAADVTVELLKALGPSRLAVTALLLALGLAFWRERRLLLPIGFAGGFLLGYGLTRPVMYFWYPGPLDGAFCLVGAWLLGDALSAASRPGNRTRTALRGAYALTIAAAFAATLLARTGNHYSLLTRPRPPEQHLRLARWLNQHTSHTDTILVGDVGYVGYYNRDRRVLDFYGLVWRGVRFEVAPAMLQDGAWLSDLTASAAPTIIACENAAAPSRPPPGYSYIAAPEMAHFRIMRKAKASPH